MAKHTVRIVRTPTQSTILVWVDEKAITPAKSQKVRDHSPDGFNAGYGGSGPAQLALGILLEIMPEKKARENYQVFKWKYLADPRFQEVGDYLIEFDIQDELEKKEAQDGN